MHGLNHAFVLLSVIVLFTMKGENIMLPFYRRFKNFFTVRCTAARSRRYMLVQKVKSILGHDFIESSFSIVRLNLRGGA